ncbi:MAG: ATP-binding protein [Omnitrophica WOR_2 bacterium]
MPRSIRTTTDLYTLLAQGMGPDLHWFPEEVSVSRLAGCLVGMANTSGGTVLLGIAPRSAQVTGVEDVKAAIDRVFQASLLSDPPLVLPVPALATVGTSGAKVVWITIPGGLPNVYSLDGSYLGREGRQTNPLSARRLRQLLIERGTIQFESQIPPGARLADLDPALVNSYLNKVYQNQTLPSSESDAVLSGELLLRRGCLQLIEGELRPNYAGILLFGRWPQQWLPNATILAAHFPGIAFNDNYIKQDISGTLPEQLQQVEAFIRDNIRTVVRLSGLAHKESLEYPFDAVRELVINAVAHRDFNFQGDNIHLNIFSDRLEVVSPGGLPGPVNLDNLLEARFSRNAVIFQVLSDMGYVERLGYGLDRVVTVMRQNMMRPPHFEEISGCFKVTLFGMEELPGDKSLPDLSVYQEYGLNSRQEMALSYLAAHPRITSSTYQELCPDVHPETLRRDLADLAQKGVLLKVGDKRATYYILKKAAQ